MQHPNKHICNVRLKKQMKHWKQKLATYAYNHCNICNIRSTFATSILNNCNIYLWNIWNTWNIGLQHALSSATSTCYLDENRGSSTRSSITAWSSMPRSKVEVARVELVGSTDLSRGRDRRMERGCDGRREFRQGHRVRAHGASGGGVRPTSKV